jgi:choline dehydrogenase-like flavoprotein|tara:strand:+ start:934 stop:2409 length:1476 start_codon:yes stop_codon:yes gene_type:complete
MIQNLNNASPLNFQKVYDLIIVGSGPAALSLYFDLNDKMDILMLEAGDVLPSQESQNIYKGKITGDPYYDLDQTRLRMLGGSSNHWGGFARQLDEIDFHPRHDSSQWPLQKNELDEFSDRAKDFLGVKRSPHGEKILSDQIKKVSMGYATAGQLGIDYRKGLEKYDNVLTNAYCTNFLMNEANEVYAIEAQNTSRNKFQFKANKFAIALGGIENSRFLLHNQEILGKRFIREDRTLGHYWADHPHIYIGHMFGLQSDAFLDHEDSSFGRYTTQSRFAFFAPTAKFLKKNDCNNFCFRVARAHWDTDLKQQIVNLACEAPKIGKKLFEAMNLNLMCSYKIEVEIELEPSFKNFISLDHTSKDPYGIPRVKHSWNVNFNKYKKDLNAYEKFFEELGTIYATKNYGRAKYDLPYLERDFTKSFDYPGGHHHMGGTRMALERERGIVNKNNELFDHKNIFILGSSVFSTFGWSNPTLSIVQLSMRAAKYILDTKL